MVFINWEQGRPSEFFKESREQPTPSPLEALPILNTSEILNIHMQLER